jgi:hypothetical protein
VGIFVLAQGLFVARSRTFQQACIVKKLILKKFRQFNLFVLFYFFPSKLL